jgi:hypothetical protein
VTPEETKARLLYRFGARCDRRTPLPLEIPDFGRAQLAEVLAGLGFRDGAEVGVLFGEYSEQLCKANPELRLRCVDPWRASVSLQEMEWMDQAKFDAWGVEARSRLAPFGCEILKQTSLEAAAAIQDRSLDFVYLDADHGLAPLINDLAAWTPKVRVGGILAGHDFVKVEVRPEDRYQGAPGQGVIPAVRAWADAYSIRPWFVLGSKAKVPGQVRDKQRSWLWVVE